MSCYQYLYGASKLTSDKLCCLLLKKEKINFSYSIKFNKWGLYASVIGEVIGNNEVIISHKDPKMTRFNIST